MEEEFTSRPRDVHRATGGTADAAGPPMRKLIIGLIVTGCAVPRAAPIMPPPVVVAPAPTQRAQLQLTVDDPTDLEARLKTEGLVVRVVVLTRQRHDANVQLHEPGTRPASGFGFVGASDDPVRAPEQHDAGREQFDFGQRYTQSDLRLTVWASLARAAPPGTLATWDDDEGTLLQRGDGAQPQANPWDAVYAALAVRLARQIAAALPRTR
jgi:hypothetical protein